MNLDPSKNNQVTIQDQIDASIDLKNKQTKPEPRKVDRGSYQVIVRSHNRDYRAKYHPVKV